VVSIYQQAGLNGGGFGDCSDESANLQSIVQYLINNSPIDIAGQSFDYSAFTVNATINSFGDSALAEKLAASTFFFMVDMEGTPTGLTPASRAILADFVANGGVMLMTGTAGNSDANFLNDVFGWDVSSVSCSTASLNTVNAAGTPFAGASETVTCPSATDHLNCGTQECTPIYGTVTSNAVSILKHGDGRVVYVGFDYYNTGYAETIADGMHSDCPNNVDPYVTDVLPLAMQLAQAFATPAVQTAIWYSYESIDPCVISDDVPQVCQSCMLDHKCKWSEVVKCDGGTTRECIPAPDGQNN
jgi:hypothetical protein